MAKISKSKNLAAGVTKKIKKAPMVDPKGAYTKVQERTLGNMRKGGKIKIKKAQPGTVESPQKKASDQFQKQLAYRKGFTGPLTESGFIKGQQETSFQERKKEFEENTRGLKRQMDIENAERNREKSPREYYGNDRYKRGGRVKKAQNGKVETRKKNLFGDVSYSTDTTGFAAGKKMFPMTATNNKTGKVTKSSAPRVIVKRQVKESQVKKNSSGGKTSKKK